MVGLALPDIPTEIADLRPLALDLRWTWSHEADALWERLDSELWRRTHNPWSVLQNVPAQALRRLAEDAGFCGKLREVSERRLRYLNNPGWFATTSNRAALAGVAYFSMEFGLGAALPLYAGGLGVLAGDFLKTASDLDIPAVGIGLLYQEGYFRQIINAQGIQNELYPHNEPAGMPIEPVILPDKGWLRVLLNFPGRTVQLRVWQASVGRAKLYLLDSNDPLNSPADRGITAKLYGEGSETRLMQEIILGLGGWRVVQALSPQVEICHVNEGHAAFALLERARIYAVSRQVTFREALWATRSGNLFSTHTPVSAGFDTFSADMIRKYLFCMQCEIGDPNVEVDELLALGQATPPMPEQPFNMAYLAQRCSAMTLAVSRLHEKVSRRIFQPLFPHWPAGEVPIGHVTNGVHIPTWDSIAADRIWTEACGKERWRTTPEELKERIAAVSDEELWAMRGQGRQSLINVAREHLSRQLRERGFDADTISRADKVLDPNVLTIGFARRFTGYKRPDLLLRDLARLDGLLTNENHPIQIILAGKAHPADTQGKEMITSWISLARKPQYRHRVVFLEDYDIALAQELVQGVDVWINTPRRPWEACGTSGMKVLVNGGLNCSVRDGWWDEAFAPDRGWAIGDGEGEIAAQVDQKDAESLYGLLEREIIPEFYRRDIQGIPRAWISRIRESMSDLTPRFASTRMMGDYLQQAYLPLAGRFRKRTAGDGALARDLASWSEKLQRHWPHLHLGEPSIIQTQAHWNISVPVLLGEISITDIRVELFAEEEEEYPAETVSLRMEQAIPGSLNGYIFAGAVTAKRPAQDYTPRIVPYHPDAQLPGELPLILWQR